MADIDLWVGGLAESKRTKEAVVGPTFVCLISSQFVDLKYGDRFYYENAPNAALGTETTAFTLGMLNLVLALLKAFFFTKGLYIH